MSYWAVFGTEVNIFSLSPANDCLNNQLIFHRRVTIDILHNDRTITVVLCRRSQPDREGLPNYAFHFIQSSSGLEKPDMQSFSVH